MGTPKNINGEDIPERAFQVFVKPVGSQCNLNCSYCYYLPHNHLVKKRNHVLMTDEVLETYIFQHIQATTESLVFFSWHGGEPLLAGIDFYRKACSMQRKYANGKTIRNGIQTNGTLLNEQWAEFLAQERFMVGISMDGPPELHDRFRKTKDGRGSFKSVLSGFDLLVMHGLDPEILCVINAENEGYPLEVYRFFKHLGVSYLTFIPLVEQLPGEPRASEKSVNPEIFGTFLCAIFDEWVAHDIGKIKVQIFEEALRTAFNQEHTLCIFKPVCGGVPVVEYNGDFYSCDHFVQETHKLGNIMQEQLENLIDSQGQKVFGQAKSEALPDYCRKCEVLVMCNGECMKNRFLYSPEGEPGLNYLCMGYRSFFNHCRPFIEAVSKQFRTTSL